MSTNLKKIEEYAHGPELIELRLDRLHAIGLISQLQVAFRQPANNGKIRKHFEEFVTNMIDKMDPDHGEVYEFLMAGFGQSQNAQPEEDWWPEFITEESK